MNNQDVQWLVKAIRDNLNDVCLPNMYSAIMDGKAPVAALVYSLALIDSMAGFYYGPEAKRINRRGDVRIRYEAFVNEYLHAVARECRYPDLDLYKSLRCAMLHGLTPGLPGITDRVFRLTWTDDPDKRHEHATKDQDGKVWFNVYVFCGHVLQAGRKFLDDVEQAISESPEPRLLKDFKAWAAQGHTIMVVG